MNIFKSLNSLASLSPIIAASAAYGINMMAVGSLNTAVEYSIYIKLQSWAVYFGSISGLCIVDLKLSPNGKLYKSFNLLGIAIIATLIIFFLFFILGIILSETQILLVSITGASYSIFRSLLMVGLFLKIPIIPILMRCIRAFLLIFLACILIAVLNKTYPFQFILCQSISALMPFLLYLPRIVKICFKSLKNTMLNIIQYDLIRIIRRNISYLIDMIHAPLFYTLIAGISAIKEYYLFIYLFGLLLPASFLLNQIIAERIRFRFGLTNLNSIIININRINKYIIICIMTYRALYSLLIICCIGSYLGIINFNIGMVISIMIQISFICTSSLSSLIISKLGIELIDISINLTITLLLITVWYLGFIAPIAAIVASLIICTKYFIQQNIAYYKLNQYEI